MVSTSQWSSASQNRFSTSCFPIWQTTFLSGEGAGLIELLLGVQEDVIEAVRGQGHRLGLAIRGRTASPPARSRHRRGNGTILQRANDDSILWRSSTDPILFRRQQRWRQSVRGLVVERGAGAVLPPVLAVPCGELIGEHPVLGAVEGAELHQAAPAPAQDLLAGQRRRQAELCIARRANDLHRRARRRQRWVGVVHGMDQVTRGIPRLGFRGLRLQPPLLLQQLRQCCIRMASRLCVVSIKFHQRFVNWARSYAKKRRQRK